MPVYKLTYFPARGYAEPIRQMFKIANVPFENHIVNREDGSWDQFKSSTPFGQVPVLEIDGAIKIPQSFSIGRYIAKKFGFYGSTPEESAWIDAINDQFKDFFTQWVQIIIAQRSGKSADEVEKIRNEVSTPAIEAWFGILRSRITASSSGYLVGSRLSWADLVVADSLTTLKSHGVYDEEKEPEIRKFQELVNGTPGLKEWLVERPHSDI